MDNADPGVGACVRSQGFTAGMRPQCWYLPPATEPKLDEVPVSVAANRTDASHAAASPLLTSLKNGGVFSGL
jgi:hypothetical protein